MPARRCSTCGINWPNSLPDFRECPHCETATWYSQNNDPDHSNAEALKIKAEAARTMSAAGTISAAPPSPAHAHRVERYLSLGFTEVDAQVLAVALEVERDSTGRMWKRPLNWLTVQRALQHGCDHRLAVTLYA